MHKALGWIGCPTWHKLGMVVYAYNPNTQEVVVEDQEFKVYLQVYKEFEAARKGMKPSQTKKGGLENKLMASSIFS